MIYCFSGTGNTKHVAQMLAKQIDSKIHFFSAQELRDPQTCVLESEDDLIIWAFPTYSWGVPPVIRNLIKLSNIDFKADAQHVAVTTCGDDIGNLASMFRKDLNSRGLRAGAVFSVQMPNTYVMMAGFDTDSPEIAQKKIHDARLRVELISKSINNKETTAKDDRVTKGKFAWFKTNIIYPWFVKFDMSPNGFNVNRNQCIGCKKCAVVCPMDNITFDMQTKPVWGNKCAFCTACYHICPRHAINWKKTTINKSQACYYK